VIALCVVLELETGGKTRQKVCKIEVHRSWVEDM
jgi:hypothetical protein